MSRCSYSDHAIVLPYDCVNIIFEYLSQILDKKWKLVIDNKDNVRLRFNCYFRPMTSVRLHFDQQSQMIASKYGGRYVTLAIRQEPANIVFQVQALQQFRSIRDSDVGICYTYKHPETNQDEVVYVDKRFVNNDPAQVTFLRGTLFRGVGKHQTQYNVYRHIVLEDGSVEITAQDWTLEWMEHYEMDAIDGLLEMGLDELNAGLVNLGLLHLDPEHLDLVNLELLHLDPEHLPLVNLAPAFENAADAGIDNLPILQMYM